MFIERTIGARGVSAHYEGNSSKILITWAVIHKRGSEALHPEHEIVGIVLHVGEVRIADEVEGFQGYRD